MKKVLEVSCCGLGNGGVQAVMMTIIRNLKAKYTFDALLFTADKRYYDDEFLSYGGKILRVPRYEGSNRLKEKLDYYIRGWFIYRNVLKLLKGNGPYDVIHCHNEDESAPVLKAAAKAGIPVRISHTHIVHGNPNIIARGLRYYRKRTIEKYATAKLGCSSEACKAFYLNGSDYTVMYNTYDEQRYDPALYTTDGFPLILIQVARFVDFKNQIFSIRILQHIVKDYPNAMLYLVGFQQGDYLNKIKQEIQVCNVSNNVRFFPGDSDIPKLLSESAYFLFPSKNTEGFGIVLIEAQAMGLHCYVSDQVPKESNAGGVTYLSLNDSPAQWADTIMEDYAVNQGRREKYDITPFKTSVIIEKYESIYEGR